MPKPARTFACPWCGRAVKSTRSGFVASHLTAGGLRCIAVGFNARQAATLRDNIDRRAK